MDRYEGYVSKGNVMKLLLASLRPILAVMSWIVISGLATVVVAQDKAAPAKTESAKTESAHTESAGTEKGAAHATPTDTAGAHAANQDHGGHHDPTDLSHQNATPGLNSPIDWRSDSAVATLLIFLCLLALLLKFAWGPIMQGLEAREQSIAASIDEAKRSAEKAGEQLRQYELKLAAATEEARGILDQARKDAESVKDRIVAEAQQAASRERQKAVADITNAKNVALQEMTQKSVDLAVSLASRLIRKQLRPEDHAQLIREMVEQFPSRN